MSVYAVVPVKDLDTSKNRLSSLLLPEERKQLTLAMLEDVLVALKSSVVDATVVVSNDLAVHEFAAKFGLTCISPLSSGLNSAIEWGTDWCIQEGAKTVLILPADLPLLSSRDVDKIVELRNCARQTVVLSPSYNGGTNALLQSPPRLISASFGQNSFARHFEEACRKGVCVKLYCSASMALDIDSVEDLYKLLRTESKNASRHALDKLSLSSRTVVPV